MSESGYNLFFDGYERHFRVSVINQFPEMGMWFGVVVYKHTDVLQPNNGQAFAC